MSNPHFTQSQKRFLESLGSLFRPEEDPLSEKEMIFIKSSSDTGVIRNKGRNGARYAPRSLLSAFKKLNQNQITREYSFREIEVSSTDEERADFHQAQVNESHRISAIVKRFSTSIFCHLGGGHDHVYPFLCAFAERYKKIVVLNVDAHADTRVDEDFHSGTPFRQFAQHFTGEFHLFQIGLHPYANSFSTLSPLEKGSSHILWREDLQDPEIKDEFFKRIRAVCDSDTLVVFSLDADALHANEVPGVSAVNVDGISSEELREIWNEYQALPKAHAPIVGIYELNPLYDTLSAMSMRKMASFCYGILNKKKAHQK